MVLLDMNSISVPRLSAFISLVSSFMRVQSLLLFTPQLINPVKIFVAKPQRNIACIFLALPVCEDIYHAFDNMSSSSEKQEACTL